MDIGNICPACSSSDMTVFYEANGVPVHSVLLLGEVERALNYPMGDIRLSLCDQCGFITNWAFDAGLQEYGSDYESTQSFSPTFDDFSRRQAAELIDYYDLRAKTILEIGCGMGEFLTLLCEQGGNRGIGFDPAYNNGRIQTEADIEFVNNFYSEEYAHYRADFLVCKMTLEHIHSVGDFVSMVRRSLENSPETIVFFQVPDMTRILREMAFWDIYYEHCSYFTPGSLARLFRKNNFNLLRLRREYDRQYVVVEACLAKEGDAPPLALEHDLDEINQLVAYFQENISAHLQAWNDYISALQNEGKRAVLWGAGSKAVAFLSTLGLTDAIEFCVDINPYKHGTFMAGTGQKIIPPEFLKGYKPDVVVIMNPVYKLEIDSDLKRMGLDVKLITVNDIDG